MTACYFKAVKVSASKKKKSVCKFSEDELKKIIFLFGKRKKEKEGREGTTHVRTAFLIVVNLKFIGVNLPLQLLIS